MTDISDWFATNWPPGANFKRGDLVCKKSPGARWRGVVVGLYATPSNPIGYAVMSISHDTWGSVQIYPESALETWNMQLRNPVTEVEALWR